ncbi:MAG: tetratricopeptide repeat protein [Flavobacteriales bacterium]|jgi:tetratricopeptide (TPR) repeat protein|nr:tetratricopeptide repeat protein [Flavobacteriales bacterium]
MTKEALYHIFRPLSNSFGKGLLVYLLLGVSTPSFSQKTTFKSQKDKINFENQFFASLDHKVKGDLEERETILKTASEQFSEMAVIDFELSKLNISKNDFGKALEYAEKAEKKEAKNIWYKIHLADLYNHEYLYSKEEKLREQIVHKFPQSTLHLGNYIECLKLNKKYQKAIEQIKIFEENFGQDLLTTKEKVSLYKTLGKEDKALESIEKLVSKIPNNTEYQSFLADYYFKLGKLEQAKNIFENILKQNPENGNAALGLFRYYYNKKEIENTDKYLLQAIKSKELNEQERNTVIEYYRHAVQKGTKSNKEFQTIVNIFLEQSPENFTLYELKGDLMKNVSEKNHWYKKALEKEENINLYGKVIISNLVEFELQEAYDFSQKAIESYSYVPNTYLWKALACQGLEKNNEGLNTLIEGLDFITDETDIAFRMHSLAAELASILSKNKIVLSHYEQALALKPNDATTLNNYSYFLAQNNQELNKALKLIEKALESHKISPSFLDTYGYVFYKMGKKEKALEQFLNAKKAKRAFDFDIEIQIANCYIDLQKTAEAKKQLNFMKENTENAHQLAEIEQKIKNL